MNLSRKHLSTLFIFMLLLAVLVNCNTKEEAEDTWQLEGFEKVDDKNPIITPGDNLRFIDPIEGEDIRWETRNVLNPAAVVRDGKVYLFYRAQDSTGTSRIGLAISEDGINFQKEPEPVFYPKNDSMKEYEWNYMKFQSDSLPDCFNCLFDGVEDPRIVESEDGKYIMTYTSYDGKTARLSLASSSDLRNWTKHGPVLSSEKYIDTWSKAGAIITKQNAGKMTATKINGKYWMYYGDTDLFMATSDDLINWEPLEDEEKKTRISVLHPRKGFFDSRLVEPGPYAMLTESGVLLIYNASNAANYNDPNFPVYTYGAGQALFDAGKPYKLLDRTDSPFIYPDKDFERVGEVNEVCFVEGLVWFKNKWFLYYGTADSKIGVAMKQ